MSKTYFAPTISEVKIAGNHCICNSNDPGTTPTTPVDPINPAESAPARKLYV